MATKTNKVIGCAFAGAVSSCLPRRSSTPAAAMETLVTRANVSVRHCHIMTRGECLLARRDSVTKHEPANLAGASFGVAQPSRTFKTRPKVRSSLREVLPRSVLGASFATASITKTTDASSARTTIDSVTAPYRSCSSCASLFHENTTTSKFQTNSRSRVSNVASSPSLPGSRSHSREYNDERSLRRLAQDSRRDTTTSNNNAGDHDLGREQTFPVEHDLKHQSDELVLSGGKCREQSKGIRLETNTCQTGCGLTLDTSGGPRIKADDDNDEINDENSRLAFERKQQADGDNDGHNYDDQPDWPNHKPLRQAARVDGWRILWRAARNYQQKDHYDYSLYGLSFDLDRAVAQHQRQAMLYNQDRHMKEEQAKQVAPNMKQSPISLMTINPCYEPQNRPLILEYPATVENLRICNTGFSWEVKIPYQISMTTALYGAHLHRYRLDQFHCHWGDSDHQGSEHTVDGTHYSGEIHFVHYNMEKYHTMSKAARHPDGLVVLSVFLDAQPDHHNHAELEKIVANLKSVPLKGDHAIIKQAVRIENLLPANRSYWSYAGSLTTPPYFESVTWFVLKQPIKCSSSQIERFRALKSNLRPDDEQVFITGNVRKTQPLNGRTVVSYDEPNGGHPIKSPATIASGGSHLHSNSSTSSSSLSSSGNRRQSALHPH